MLVCWRCTSLLSRPLFQDAGGNDCSLCGFVLFPGFAARTDGHPAGSDSSSSCVADTFVFIPVGWSPESGGYVLRFVFIPFECDAQREGDT